MLMMHQWHREYVESDRTVIDEQMGGWVDHFPVTPAVIEPIAIAIPVAGVRCPRVSSRLTIVNFSLC